MSDVRVSDGLPEPTRREVGARVQQARREKGISYELLAGQAGISASTLHRIINGVHDAGAVEIWRIARATEKPFAFFAGEDAKSIDRLAAAATELAMHARTLGTRADSLLAAITSALDEELDASRDRLRRDREAEAARAERTRRARGEGS